MQGNLTKTDMEVLCNVIILFVPFVHSMCKHNSMYKKYKCVSYQRSKNSETDTFKVYFVRCALTIETSKLILLYSSIYIY